MLVGGFFNDTIKGENMNIIEGIVLIIGIICATLLGLSYIFKDEIIKK